jgi:hypothetical protein
MKSAPTLSSIPAIPHFSGVKKKHNPCIGVHTKEVKTTPLFSLLLPAIKKKRRNKKIAIPIVIIVMIMGFTLLPILSAKMKIDDCQRGLLRVF